RPRPPSPTLFPYTTLFRSITLFQPFRDFEGLPEPHRSQAFERARRKFDVMEELGAGLMLICSSVSPQAMGGIDRAADDLAELGRSEEHTSELQSRENLVCR